MEEKWQLDIPLSAEELDLLIDSLTRQIIYGLTMAGQFKNDSSPRAAERAEKFSQLSVDARRLQLAFEELAQHPRSVEHGWRRVEPALSDSYSEPTAKATILVIDDDVQIRQLFGEALEEEGYDIRLAKNGLDGLVLIEEQVPSLILLDLNMPYMDGTTFGEELAMRGISVPIVAVTGLNHRQERLAEASIVEVLHKPVPLAKLVSTVAKYVQ